MVFRKRTFEEFSGDCKFKGLMYDDKCMKPENEHYRKGGSCIERLCPRRKKNNKTEDKDPEKENGGKVDNAGDQAGEVKKEEVKKEEIKPNEQSNEPKLSGDEE